MNPLRSLAKRIVPAGARDWLKSQGRDFVFGRAMREFLRDPAACAATGNPVLARLIRGWGNDGWSALDEYLAASLQAALAARGPILECGSGLSTLLIGAVAQRIGQRHFALEHTPEWADRVKHELSRFAIDSVTVCVCPLRDFGDFAWYDVSGVALPDDIALALCDGPPGETKGGRIGLVPTLRHRLRPGCVILLDDAERPEERAVADRWGADLGAPTRDRGTKKPFVELAVPCR
jgi:hypothetical protein